MNTLFSLEGQVAIVTGSSRGIGRSIAEEMARCGAKVVVSSRKAEACEAVRDALVDEGREAMAVACNTSRKSEIEVLVDRVLQTFGRIDHVVANVATNPYYGPLAKLPEEIWSKVIDTNVRATWWLSTLTLTHIATQGGGSFTIVSSIGALQAHKMLGVYNVSKCADIALARNLALEWGERNVRVNAIAPGVIRTDFSRALWDDPSRVEAIERATPLGRMGKPIDIAGVAAFLASPAGHFVTGQLIIADGGITIASPVA